MIHKQEYYHGVAVVKMLDDARCKSITKFEDGYYVNDKVLVFLKYSTKNRPPWPFIITPNEFEKITTMFDGNTGIYLALICGGDGVCAVNWGELLNIIDKDNLRISVNRGFNKLFSVSGSNGTLKNKIAISSWPGVLFT